MAICPNCRGKGDISRGEMIRETKECPSCDGRGKVAESYRYWRRCKNCDGWGEVGDFIRDRCDECNGLGIVPGKSESVERRRRGRSIHIRID